MMCGTPIVASHIPALHQVLGPDSAVYAAPDDVHALVEAVRQILGTPTPAKKISAASSSHAARFSLERMVTEYEQSLALLN
jgi:glycosyltransferase involved in cell wall biosynthesis